MLETNFVSAAAHAPAHSIDLRVVNVLDEKTWRQFVEQHPHGNIFHTPEMFQVFARAKGYQPHLWSVVDADDCPRALLLPVNVSVLSGALSRLTTRAIAYGSVLSQSDANASALKTLLRVYRQNARGTALLTELRNLHDLNELQPALRENGFAYEDHLDYLIDLHRPAENVLQSFGPRTRKKIRHALRQGEVVIEEATTREQVSVCYQLLQKTYATANVPLADASLFQAAFDVLYPRGMVKFLLAKIGEQYAAGSVELIYKDVIYGWYGGMDRAFSEHIPNEILLWHIFKWGADNGYRVYDFGGAGKPNEKYGVRDFKAKFGGTLVNFGRNTWVHAPRLFKFATTGYNLYRRVRQKI